MSRLIWSPQALLDVQGLYQFLASKNIRAAKRAASVLREGVKVLGNQPSIGRPVEDMPNEFREWMIDYGDTEYIVRYRVDAVTVVILAVRHQKEV
jgi:plasmid stabilization system protein ParE